ncbi:MAG: LPS-assembly protein LptD, partial [Deltaproteobacteria bacterium]|nr:LPS-assembly protein LptD [Deltaproteobacteria bacterium]
MTFNFADLPIAHCLLLIKIRRNNRKVEMGIVKAVVIVFLLISLLKTNPSIADGPIAISVTPDQPVEIYADTLSYEKETDTYYAEGNVVVIQGRSQIKATRMTLDMGKGIAIAIGDVEATDEGGNILKGERLEVDINNRTGVVNDGRLFFKEPNLYVSGEEIRKTAEESYEVKKGVFTNCDCKAGRTPAWSFSAKEAQITFGEYLHAWSTFFRIKDIPVLYSPYIVYPVKRERQTGFLFPDFGYSELRGFKMDNVFFWAISDSTDATFYLDIETNRGLGKGLEYRYIWSRKSEGEVFFYQFQEDDINRVREFRSGSQNLSRPATASDDRWLFKFKHREDLPWGISLKADIKRVSDDEYFIDFGKNLEERSLESLESNVSISKGWEWFNLVAQFRYFDNLLSANDETTLQRLPEVSLTGTNRRLWKTPFYLSLESSFVNFERELGVEGRRLDLHPRVSLPLNPEGYFELTPSIGYRETLYWVDEHPDGRFQTRGLYDINTELVTTFVRVFNLDGEGVPFSQKVQGVDKIKHTIRPRVSYTYIPYEGQENLPSFDGIDRIAKTNSITYSLNSTLTGRLRDGDKYSYHDYLYMDISQSFDIHEVRKDLPPRRPFSDVTGEVILKPFQWMKATARGQYDINDHWFENYNTSLDLEDKRGDSLTLNHRYTRRSTRYLDTSARFKVTDTIDLTYRNRYSYRDETGVEVGKTIETVYGLDYHHQCWGMVLTYTERLEEKVFMLTFNLL